MARVNAQDVPFFGFDTPGKRYKNLLSDARRVRLNFDAGRRQEDLLYPL